jgi:hypothetical protein
VHQITNSNGTILKEMSFDPWGLRRNPNDWAYSNVPTYYPMKEGGDF